MRSIDRTMPVAWMAQAPRWAAGAKRLGRVAALATLVGLGAVVVAAGAPVLMLGAGFAAAGVDQIVRAQAIRGRFRGLPLVRDFASLKRGANPVGVRVRGRVRCGETIPSLLTGAPAALRRLDLRVDLEEIKLYVHEAGHDFELEDERGERIMVRLGGGELFAPTKVLGVIHAPGVQARILEELSLEFPGQQIALYAAEHLVVEGQQLEVVGTRTREADPGGEAVLRETAWRTVLASGKAPVVVFL